MKNIYLTDIEAREGLCHRHNVILKNTKISPISKILLPSYNFPIKQGIILITIGKLRYCISRVQTILSTKLGSVLPNFVLKIVLTQEIQY